MAVHVLVFYCCSKTYGWSLLGIRECFARLVIQFQLVVNLKEGGDSGVATWCLVISQSVADLTNAEGKKSRKKKKDRKTKS